MDTLQQIKRDLISIIKCHRPSRKEKISIFRFQVTGYLELLSWLKAQDLYPQFYLNFRDNDKKLASIGTVLSFSALNEAQQFILSNKVSLVGGMKFNNNVMFFLPRLLLEQTKDSLCIQFVINNEINWLDEKKEILELLDSLTLTKPIQDIKQTIQLQTKKASQQEWESWVEDVLREIKKGILTKVVLSNETNFVTDSPLDDKDFLAKSEKYNKDCYHFLLAENKHCTFLGSSPERLYQRNGQSLVTEAVAGTAVITDNEKQNKQQATWLLNDEKNGYENWLVVKDIKQNLFPHIEEINIQDKEIKRLRQVQHLKRRITARLKCGYLDQICLESIHPTAAVAGVPKKESKSFIQQVETFSREWYAGTLGIMAEDYAEFTVTIRSAFIEDNNIRILAGAGIVEGSVPLLEWEEIERKALGLISLLHKE
ncbi:isochorismate synthase [Bisgaardia hudsonensis]|uniref:Isochorismate synthase MenF n=1 Tax=Bisgaardia hudsonensis TaxID=109472 RepID=A0A4R2N250_9PAST|nr:isochorismate synthase [Bisgaardia hudsonensis]QLB12394.1 isochorismate synthase [Bisgaardia hudsonensis]TCP13921.1 isochorismate synthase [Bisgaardia hudsonensis]